VWAAWLCQGYHHVPGLTFVWGNAEAIEFGQDAFEIALTVESSHCYGAMDRFLAGILYVLKPGGCLLYADHRNRADIPALRQQLWDAGLAVVEEKPLNAAILRARVGQCAQKGADSRQGASPAPALFQSVAPDGGHCVDL
jgi:ubiquinone/menaquinone biosynthesis C-methylase UbiE